jgi:hypothetical protein
LIIILLSLPIITKLKLIPYDMILRMKNKRRIARHTHTLLMEELADVVHNMLKKDTGEY